MKRSGPKLIALAAVVVFWSACHASRPGSGCGSLTASEASNLASTQRNDSTKGSTPGVQDKPSGERSPESKAVDTRHSGPRVEANPPRKALPPERPWAGNTGPTTPDALKPAGSLTITEDGTLLENLAISGSVSIEANNVTIRNFRIESTSHYGIKIASGHSGILLKDGEISGMSSAAILGVGFTARRLHIHDSGGDGLKVQGTGGPTLVESCFIEKLGTDEGAHADGNQTRGGSNITFRYNNIFMPSPGTPSYPGEPYKSNATFFLQLGVSNFVIEHNWLTGGNYTVYCLTDNKGVFVRNNVFGRDNAGRPQRKEDRRLRTGDCEEWSGNRWEDTGAPI